MDFSDAVLDAFVERGGRRFRIITEPKTVTNYGILGGTKRYVVGEDVPFALSEPPTSRACTSGRCKQSAPERMAALYEDVAHLWDLVPAAG